MNYHSLLPLVTITTGLCALSLTSCVSIFSKTPNAAELLDSKIAPVEEQAEVKALLAQSSTWVNDFKSSELDALINLCFDNNLSWQQMQRTLKQAGLDAKISGADQLPRISIGADYVNTDSLNKTSSLSNASSASKEYSVGGALSWEIDFWGSVRAQKLSSLAQYEKTQASYRQAALVLSSEVVNTYFDLITQQELVNLQEQQTKASKETLELITQKQELGLGNKLDVKRQEQLLIGLQVRRTDYLNSYQQAKNALAVLIGQNPSNYSFTAIQDLPRLGKLPKIKDQHTLIYQVPSLMEAYYQVVSDKQDLAVAFADRLPSFTLSASYELSSAKTSSNLYDQVANFALNASQTIFDYGRLKNLNRKAKLELEKSVLAFQQQYLITIEDLENALTQEKFFKQKWELIKQQEQLAKESFEEASKLYANGEREFIDVLDSISSWQALQQDAILAKRNMLNARVQLYLALGGN